MKKNKLVSALAVFLSVIMLIGSFPAAVFAADSRTGANEAVPNYSEYRGGGMTADSVTGVMIYDDLKKLGYYHKSEADVELSTAYDRDIASDSVNANGFYTTVYEKYVREDVPYLYADIAAYYDNTIKGSTIKIKYGLSMVEGAQYIDAEGNITTGDAPYKLSASYGNAAYVGEDYKAGYTFVDEDNDGKVDYTTRYFDEKSVIFYIINHSASERIGEEDDVSIISDYVEQGYLVVTVDFKSHKDATTPYIEESLGYLRDKLGDTCSWTYCTDYSTCVTNVSCQSHICADVSDWTDEWFFDTEGNLFDTEGDYFFYLPEGCRLERDVWFYDSSVYGPEGTMHAYRNKWNERISYERTGYLSTDTDLYDLGDLYTEEELIQLVGQDSGTDGKTVTVTRHDGTTEEVTMGVPLEYKDSMSIVYPSQPKNGYKAPVYIQEGTNYVREANSTNGTRNHVATFALQGYASVIYDHCYWPFLYRNGYLFQDNGSNYTLGSAVLRDNARAAVRCVRYYADELGYDAEKIGAAGISKATVGISALCMENNDEIARTSFSFTDVLIQKQNAANGTSNATWITYKNDSPVHEGDLRDAEGNVTDTILQPFAYDKNGEKLSSDCQTAYISSGDGIKTLFGTGENSANKKIPLIISGGVRDQYHCYDYWEEMVDWFNESDTLDSYFPMVQLDKGHDYPIGYDIEHGYERLDTMVDWFDYYLKGETTPKLVWATPIDGSVDVPVTGKWDVGPYKVYANKNNDKYYNVDYYYDQAIQLRFLNSVVPDSVNAGAYIVSMDGEKVDGEWVASQGNALYTFVSSDLQPGTNYTLNVTKLVKDENGVALAEERSVSFETEGTCILKPVADANISKNEPQKVISGNTLMADSGNTILLSYPTNGISGSTKIVLRGEAEFETVANLKLSAMLDYLVDETTATYNSVTQNNDKWTNRVELSTLSRADETLAIDISALKNAEGLGEYVTIVIESTDTIKSETAYVFANDFEVPKIGDEKKVDYKWEGDETATSYTVVDIYGNVSNAARADYSADNVSYGPLWWRATGANQSAKLIDENGNQVFGATIEANSLLKFANAISDDALTADDLGKQYRVSFKIKTPESVELSVGFGAAATVSGVSNAFVLYGDKATASCKAGEWTEICVVLPVTQTMIDAQAGMLTVNATYSAATGNLVYLDDIKVEECTPAMYIPSRESESLDVLTMIPSSTIGTLVDIDINFEAGVGFVSGAEGTKVGTTHTVYGDPVFSYDESIGRNVVIFDGVKKSESSVTADDVSDCISFPYNTSAQNYVDFKTAVEECFTYEAYFKLNTEVTSTSDRCIIGSENGGGFALYVNDSDGVVGKNSIRFRMRSGTGDNGHYTDSVVIDVNRYYHVFATYSDSTETLNLYVNPIDQYNPSFTPAATKEGIPADYTNVPGASWRHRLVMGANVGMSATNYLFSPVTVAEFRMYDAVLNTSKMTALFKELQSTMKNPPIDPDAPVELPEEFGTPTLRFIATSDTHYETKWMTGTNRLETAINQIAEYFEDDTYNKLDAVVIAGDFVNNGTTAEFEAAVGKADGTKGAYQTMLPEGTKLILALGNHEYNQYKGEFAAEGGTTAQNYVAGTISAKYEEITGLKSTEDIVINGYHFMTVRNEGKMPKSNGWRGPGFSYTDEDLQILDGYLSDAVREEKGTQKPIFVIGHIPNSDTVVGSMENSDFSVPELAQVAGKYSNVVYFSGHTHNAANDEFTLHQDKFTSVNCGGLKTAGGAEGDIAETMSGGSVVFVVEVDEYNRTRLRLWDVETGGFTDKEWRVDSYNTDSFKYDENTYTADDIFFAKDAKVEASTTDSSISLKFPIVPDESLTAKGYMAKVYSGDALVEVQTVAVNYVKEDRTTDVMMTVSNLASNTEYRVDVHAVNPRYYQSLYHADALLSKPISITVSTQKAVIDSCPADLVDINIDTVLGVSNGSGLVVTTQPSLALGDTEKGIPTYVYDSTIGMSVVDYDGSVANGHMLNYQNITGFMGEVSGENADFTFEAYVKIDEKPTSEKAIISSHHYGGFGLWIDANGLYFTLTDDAETDKTFRTPSLSYDIGKYYHIIVTLANNELKLYKNEVTANNTLPDFTKATASVSVVSDSEETPLAYKFTPAATYRHRLVLGGDVGMSATVRRNTDCSIAEFRMYSKALDAEDMQNCYKRLQSYLPDYTAPDGKLTIKADTSIAPSQLSKKPQTFLDGGVKIGLNWGNVKMYDSPDNDGTKVWGLQHSTTTTETGTTDKYTRDSLYIRSDSSVFEGYDSISIEGSYYFKTLPSNSTDGVSGNDTATSLSIMQIVQSDGKSTLPIKLQHNGMLVSSTQMAISLNTWYRLKTVINLNDGSYATYIYNDETEAYDKMTQSEAEKLFTKEQGGFAEGTVDFSIITHSAHQDMFLKDISITLIDESVSTVSADDAADYYAFQIGNAGVDAGDSKGIHDFDIRFVSFIEPDSFVDGTSSYYSEAGYDVTAYYQNQDGSVEKANVIQSSNNVFSSILVDGETWTPNGENSGKYMSVMAIRDIYNSYTDIIFKVHPYAVLKDGTIKYGLSQVLVYSGVMNNEIPEFN